MEGLTFPGHGEGGHPELIKGLLEHLTVVLSMVGAFAYLLGTLSVSSFAAQFEVAPSDLGLDFRDQIVLFVINSSLIMSFLLLIFASTYLIAKWRPRGRLRGAVKSVAPWLLVVAIGFVCYVANRYLNLEIFSLFLATFFVVRLALTTAESIQQGERRLNWVRAVFMLIPLLGLLAYNATQSARSWGAELREWPDVCEKKECADPPLGPLGLR